jgi:hypothetical protein
VQKNASQANEELLLTDCRKTKLMVDKVFILLRTFNIILGKKEGAGGLCTYHGGSSSRFAVLSDWADLPWP